jgi:hypothetical protein
MSTTHPDSGFHIGQLSFSGDSLIQIDNTKKIQKCSEGQASVYHQNSRANWLAATKLNVDSIYFFYLTDVGLRCCPVIQKFNSQSYEFMQIKFSPSSKFFTTSNHLTAGVTISKFDNESAILSSDLSIYVIKNFGIAFSPNEDHLLVESIEKEIAIYDIDSFDKWAVINSKKTLIPSPNERLGSLQLNNNGEVLFARLNTPYLGKINFEEDTITWNKQGYYLGTNRKSYFGLPNFNASYFYTPSIDFAYTEDCWGHSYRFEGRDTLKATSWKWIFRDVRNETVDVRLGKNVSYTFPQADSLENKYEVTHIASTASRSDTVTKTLTIRPKWDTDMLGRDTFYCEDTKANISLIAAPDMHCVHWNGEEPNLDESLGPIVDYDHFHSDTLVADTAGTYIVKVTNKTFCQMWDTLRVTEMPRPSKSVISRNGNTLKSSISANAYRWYFNGEIDTLTLQPFYVPMANGYWQVQLVSEFGCESELSDSLNVGFAALDHRYETLDFRLYPNPSNGYISIEVPKSGEYRIQVTDLNGKLIYSTTQNLSPRMSLFAAANEFANGTYIITRTDEAGNVGSEKVEVVR